MSTQSEINYAGDKRNSKRLIRWIMLIALVGFIAFSGLCIFIDRYGHHDFARPAQAIIILGARVGPDHHPGDSLRARTRQAVSLYRAKYADTIICTGGLGDYPPTEAEAAARLAERLGIPSSNILLEQQSTDTKENARNAAKICRAHGWSRVIAVSDSYHLYRVRRNFRLVGITAYTSPAHACERDRKPLLRLQWTVREAAALIRDFCSDTVR